MWTWRAAKSLRFACADVENKPGTYGGGDYTFPKLTAIGFQFLDEDEGVAWCLDRTDVDGMSEGAEEFRSLWTQADVIIGHNWRRHDQKLLDGFYTSLGASLLPRRKVIDTYLDQPKMQGFSRSLENLADRWECPEKKMKLSEHDWEQAYDGVPEGVEKMRERVLSDVRINIWLYRELLERGLLNV